MNTASQGPSTALAPMTLTNKLAVKLYNRLELPQEFAGELIDTMIATLVTPADGAGLTDAQVQAFLIVADAHKLNPWLKEIYAFPAKGGGIMPIVGVDGWVRIITTHPDYDGHEFLYNGSKEPPADPKTITSVTCRLYRKGHTRPTEVVEFMHECKGGGPAWSKTPARMLRHRALMQAGRYAFGLGGIHTEEDAEVVGGPATATDPTTGVVQSLTPVSKREAAAAPAPAFRSTGEVVDVESKPAQPDQPAQADAFTEPPKTEQPQAQPTTAAESPPPQQPAADGRPTDAQIKKLTLRATAAGTTLEAVLKARSFALDTLTLAQAAVVQSHLMSGQANGAAA